MAKEYFHAYHSYLEALAALSDAECGRLFKACLQYSKTGEAPALTGNERILFPSWKSQIDRENLHYAAMCEKNRKAIEKRWAFTKGTDEYGRIQANDCVYETYQREREDKSEDKGKEEVHIFFERVWASYPNKKGKGQVSDAQKKKLFAIGFEQLTRCIERYKEAKEDWKAWQNGSTFFHSGYIDYLDANYEEEPRQPEPENDGWRVAQ